VCASHAEYILLYIGQNFLGFDCIIITESWTYDEIEHGYYIDYEFTPTLKASSLRQLSHISKCSRKSFLSFSINTL
jgi:hypothetical protein